MFYIEFILLCIGFLGSLIALLIIFNSDKLNKEDFKTPYKEEYGDEFKFEFNENEKGYKLQGILLCVVLGSFCFFLGMDYGKDLFLPGNKQEITVRIVELYERGEEEEMNIHYFVKGEDGKKYRVSKAKQKQFKINHLYKITYYKHSEWVIRFEEIKEEREPAT